MTESHLPILPDGLFDGGLAADVAPKDLRAAVDVLRIAQQPGSVAELALMADKVQQFMAEVNAGAPAVGIRSTAQAATTSFLTPDTTRSTPMFATRITRKAFTVVAITLLAAGTAAAAAGGALPMFVDDEPQEIVEVVDPPTVDAADDVNDASGDDAADDETASPPTSEDAVDNQNGDVDHHGKCTAWTNGAAKDASNPSFAELQVAADAEGVSIDEYCAGFLANSDDSDDESDGEDTDETDTKTKTKSNNGNSGNGNSGNGNSGNGNSGNGNSGNGNGNGNSDHSDDDEDNSGNGNGNSGHGNGNSGNGNSGNGHGNSGHGNDKSDD